MKNADTGAAYYSQLTNPASIDRAIERLAASAAEELHKQGLLR
jgi:hypothetical protein